MHTYRSLGKLAKVSANTVANIERGYAKTPDTPIRPGRDTLVKIADALGLDPGMLLDAYGIEGRRSSRFDVTGLSPQQVAQVRGYIDGLRDQ